jgi:hypothetical protein
MLVYNIPESTPPAMALARLFLSRFEIRSYRPNRVFDGSLAMTSRAGPAHVRHAYAVGQARRQRLSLTALLA